MNGQPMSPPAIAPVKPKPHGFDSGLKCLAAVFIFTLITRVVLTLVNPTHSIPLIKLALAGVLIGQAAIFVTAYIVWSRRHESQHPPRPWAIALALVWVSLQFLVYIVVMGRAFLPE